MNTRLSVSIIVIVLLLIGVGYWYNQTRTTSTSDQTGNQTNNTTQNQTNPNQEVTDSPETLTATSDWKTYTNQKYAFEFKFPDYYEAVTEISASEVYPQLNYEKAEPKAVAAYQLRADTGGGKFAGMYPRADVIIYSASQSTLDAWLAAHQLLAAGFAEQAKATIGANQFVKFTGPAGDLVPSQMYLIAHGGYVFQINVDYGLSGATPKVTAEEILTTLKFTK